MPAVASRRHCRILPRPKLSADRDAAISGLRLLVQGGARPNTLSARQFPHFGSKRATNLRTMRKAGRVKSWHADKCHSFYRRAPGREGRLFPYHALQTRAIAPKPGDRMCFELLTHESKQWKSGYLPSLVWRRALPALLKHFFVKPLRGCRPHKCPVPARRRNRFHKIIVSAVRP